MENSSEISDIFSTPLSQNGFEILCISRLQASGVVSPHQVDSVKKETIEDQQVSHLHYLWNHTTQQQIFQALQGFQGWANLRLHQEIRRRLQSIDLYR